MDYMITNLVTSGTLGKPVDLFKLSTELHDNCDYEPEQFPAAILKFKGRKVLVFRNGKVVVAGFKKEADIKPYLDELEVLLLQHLMVEVKEDE